MATKQGKHDPNSKRFIRRWQVSDYAPEGADFKRGFEAAFLENVSRLVPELVSTLRSEVLPEFQALERLADEVSDPTKASGLLKKYEIAGEPPPIIGSFDRSNVDFSERPPRLRIRWSALRYADEATRFYPDFVSLRSALERWAASYNMAGHDFFLDAALRTLAQWSQLPDFDDDCLVLPGRAGFSPVSDEESRFRLETSGWDPAFERFSSFETRLRKQFDAEIARYKARLEELTEARGYKRVPGIYRTEHIEWLALFQCAGQSHKAIQQQLRQDPTTISKGIKSAAQLIGISLRTKGRGRPRKLKT
jgi:hypothetical protein